MEGVQCISSSMVQAPTHRAGDQRVVVTPWDLHLILAGSIQKGLLFPKPQTEINFVQHLKNSLAHTLDHFPSLAGRLATTEHEDETTSFFIDCNNAGALFVHAKADGVTISDILEPVYVPSIVHSFFPLNGIRNSDVSNSLLGVQVTELVDGVFIGATINHSAVDGTSFWHFFNSWSEISRSNSFHLSKPPVFQRPVVDGIKYPIRIDQSLFKKSHKWSLPPLKERYFHFSKQSIAKLKAKANGEMGTTNISSLQALLSHLWKSVARNKNLDLNEEMPFFMMIGARPRLQNLLPENYFGNAVTTGSVTMKIKELQEQGIGEIAMKMNRMIATHTEEEFKKGFVSWSKPMAMDDVLSNFLATGSSPRFNIYGNDFGWGKPVAVRSGSANKFDGKLTLFCGAEEGSIQIEACLLPETLDSMAKDQEFMETVTV